MRKNHIIPYLVILGVFLTLICAANIVVYDCASEARDSKLKIELRKDIHKLEKCIRRYKRDQIHTYVKNHDIATDYYKTFLTLSLKDELDNLDSLESVYIHNILQINNVQVELEQNLDSAILRSPVNAVFSGYIREGVRRECRDMFIKNIKLHTEWKNLYGSYHHTLRLLDATVDEMYRIVDDDANYDNVSNDVCYNILIYKLEKEIQEFESYMYKLSRPDNPYIEDHLEYLELWKYDLELQNFSNCSTNHLYRKKIPSTKQAFQPGGQLPIYVIEFSICSSKNYILSKRLVPMFQYIHTLASNSDHQGLLGQ